MPDDVATMITTMGDFVVKRTLLVPFFWNRVIGRVQGRERRWRNFREEKESALQISSRGGESDRAMEREMDKRG